MLMIALLVAADVPSIGIVVHNVCFSIGMNLVSSEHSLLTTKALGAQKKFATKMKFILVDRESALKVIW
jgi:hypothetical protein